MVNNNTASTEAVAELDALEPSRRLDILEHILLHSPAVAFLARASDRWPIEFVTENIQQFGYNADDFYQGQLRLADIIHPEALPRVQRQFNIFTRKGADRFSVIFRLLTANKQIRWIDGHLWIHRDDANRITHYHGILLDITDRKLLEDVLDEEKFFITNVFNNSADGLAVARTNGEFVAINPAVWQLFQCQPRDLRALDDLLQIAFADCEQRVKVKRIWTRDLKRHKRSVHIFPISSDHRKQRWFRFQLSTMGEAHVLLTCQDISETKQKEEELRNSRQILAHRVKEKTTQLTAANQKLREQLTAVRELLNAIDDAAFMIDANLIITAGNQAFADVIGKPLEKINGLSLVTILRKLKLDLTPAADVRAIFTTGKTAMIAGTINDRHYHGRISPIPSNDNQITRAVGVIRRNCDPEL